MNAEEIAIHAFKLIPGLGCGRIEMVIDGDQVEIQRVTGNVEPKELDGDGKEEYMKILARQMIFQKEYRNNGNGKGRIS